METLSSRSLSWKRISGPFLDFHVIVSSFLQQKFLKKELRCFRGERRPDLFENRVVQCIRGGPRVRASIDRHHFRVSVSNDSITFAIPLKWNGLNTLKAERWENVQGSLVLSFFESLSISLSVSVSLYLFRKSTSYQLIILRIIICILPAGW